MNRLTFDKQNRERIQEVENSFGPSGQPLSRAGRILMGEGRLVKQCRKTRKTKAFFLFSDILVYGGIILNGRWYTNQNIINLEDIQLQDIEDTEKLKNQWLIRTPQKSFFVSATTHIEKEAWMGHIRQCQTDLLQGDSQRRNPSFANSWIPDQAAFKCMRCFNNFTPTKRRHHCRKCGFLVCNSCSKHRVVIAHIHPTKKLRMCTLCFTKLRGEELARLKRDSAGKNSSEEEDEEEAAVSSDEEGEDLIQIHTPSNWLDMRHGTWGRMSAAVGQ